VDPTDESAADAAATPGPDDTTDTTDAPAADAAEPASADESVEAQDETTDVEVTRAASEKDSSGTGSAGLVILGGLAGAGLLAVAGYAAVARKRKGTIS
jgi:hypothetical protein